MTGITLSEGLEVIENNAFAGSLFTDLTIPSSVISIDKSAFVNCDLITLTILDGVSSIGTFAFANNQLTGVIIPNSVTSLGSDVFYNNKLETVTISTGITSIKASTFAVNQLINVTIPDNVTSLGTGAFFNNKITSLTLPEGLDSIGESAFTINQIDTIAIPKSVTFIGKHAYAANRVYDFILPAHDQGYIWDWDNGLSSGDLVTDFTLAYSRGSQSSLYEFSIVYSLDGGSSLNASTYNVEQNIALLDASKSGYTFSGWYRDADFVEPITEIALGTTGELNLYAKFEILTSIFDEDDAIFSIYPNPSSSYISTSLEIETITITNANGVLVIEFNTPSDHYSIAELETGMYTIQAVDVAGNTYSGKLVKE